MQLRSRFKHIKNPETKLNTQQAHSKQEWVSLHHTFVSELGSLREYVDLNINVSLAKDYE